MTKHTTQSLQPELPFGEVARGYITLGRDAIDIGGNQYERLHVLGPVDRTADKKILWLCRCECGNETTVTGKDLRSGHTRSCGCLAKDIAWSINYKHGMSGMRIFNIWRSMIDRCTNPKNKTYPMYGGRGIHVFEQWLNSFVSFFAEVGHPTTKEHSLDRIDTNGHYEPGNVRWATVQEQAWNTRQNVRYEWSGQSLTLGQWAIHTGIQRSTLSTRIHKLGWNIERTLTTPVRATRINHQSANSL